MRIEIDQRKNGVPVIFVIIPDNDKEVEILENNRLTNASIQYLDDEDERPYIEVRLS